MYTYCTTSLCLYVKMYSFFLFPFSVLGQLGVNNSIISVNILVSYCIIIIWARLSCLASPLSFKVIEPGLNLDEDFYLFFFLLFVLLVAEATVTMLVDCIAHLCMFVCLFMFFSFPLHFLHWVISFLKYTLQDGFTGFWVTTGQRTYRRAEVWACWQHWICYSHDDYKH